MSDKLDSIINTLRVADIVSTRLREDQAKALTGYELVHAFHDQPTDFVGTTFPEQTINIPKLFEFLARLVCPPVCVGHVNASGWHRLCEQKAQDAIQALGFPVPELTPIPEAS